MQLPSEIIEQIEQYLNGRLDGKALREFEDRLKTDGDLAKEVAFQRELHLFLEDSPENELRKSLQLLNDQVVEPKKEDNKGLFWWLFPTQGVSPIINWLLGHPIRHLAWFLPILLLASWWLINRQEILPKSPIAVEDSSKVSPILPLPELGNPIVDNEKADSIKRQDSINKVLDPKVEKPYVKQEGEPNPSKRVLPKISPEKIEQPIDNLADTLNNPKIDIGTMGSVPTSKENKPNYVFSTPPPIYWKDSESTPPIEFFDPNIYFGTFPKLESLITQNNTHPNFKINVEQKLEVIYLTKEDTSYSYKVPEHQFKAIVSTSKDLQLEDPVLYIKDNQDNNYGPFSLKEYLTKNDENTYSIDMPIKLWDSTPRLAYYSIEDYQTEETYFVEKFVVLPKDSLFSKEDFPWNGSIIRLADLVFNQLDTNNLPNFFEPIPTYEKLINQNGIDTTFNIAISPLVKDTFRIFGDPRFMYDSSSPDSVRSSVETLKDSLFTFQIKLNTTDNLFENNIHYKVVDNLGVSVNSSSYLEDYVLKKYGTNDFFFDLKLDFFSDYPRLYYYQISGNRPDGSAIIYYTGKYVVGQ